MSGTVKSNATSVDFVYNSIGKYQSSFALVAKTLDSHPGCSRIASYYGFFGSGFNGAQASGSVGNTAWGVWRFNSSSTGIVFDLAVAVSYGPDTFDAATNGVWKAGGSGLSGLGFSMAWHSSSAAWNGTAVNNGVDTFTASTTQPWKSGSFVFPAANNSLTNKNATTPDLFSSITSNQVFCSVDNDGIYFVVGSTTNGSKVVDFNFYAGAYTTVTSSNNVPLVMGLFDRADAGNLEGSYGGISNFSGSGSLGVIKGRLGGPFGGSNPFEQTHADTLFFPQEREKFYEFPFLLLALNTDAGGDSGWFVGKMTSMYLTNPSIDTFRLYATGSRMTVRSDTAATGLYCSTIPWEAGKKVKET